MPQNPTRTNQTTKNNWATSTLLWVPLKKENTTFFHPPRDLGFGCSWRNSAKNIILIRKTPPFSFSGSFLSKIIKLQPSTIIQIGVVFQAGNVIWISPRVVHSLLCSSLLYSWDFSKLCSASTDYVSWELHRFPPTTAVEQIHFYHSHLSYSWYFICLSFLHDLAEAHLTLTLVVLPTRRLRSCFSSSGSLAIRPADSSATDWFCSRFLDPGWPDLLTVTLEHNVF